MGTQSKWSGKTSVHWIAASLLTVSACPSIVRSPDVVLLVFFTVRPPVSFVCHTGLRVYADTS